MNDDLQRVVAQLRERAVPDAGAPEYACDACHDTGIVVVDDGFDEDGRRVRPGSARPCTSMVHQPAPTPVDDPTVERFS